MSTNLYPHDAEPLMDYRDVARWFALGDERGAYDAPAPDVGGAATPALDRWLAVDGPRVVQDAAAFLASGRAHRPAPALHTIARAIVGGPPAARWEALAAIPGLTTGAQLFALLRHLRGRTPWGPALRDAVGAWYTRRSTDELAACFVQAPHDEGWSHREALALARPVPPTDAHGAMFRWLAEGKLPRRPGADRGLDLVAHWARLQETTSPLVARSIVERWPGLRAALPDRLALDPALAAWLMSTNDGAALLGWVGRLAAHGALTADGPGAAMLTARLADPAAGPWAGVAPFEVLAAWAAVRFEAACGRTPPAGLEAALYARFHERLTALPRHGASLLVALDPAASTALDGLPACPGLDPRTALAALALMAVASAEQARVLVYGRDLVPLDLARGDDLRGLIARLGQVRAGTVDALTPIESAFEADRAVTGFVVLGGTRPLVRPAGPDDLLARYRRQAGLPARWVGVSLGQHRLVPRPPASHDALAIHGWDAGVPALLGEWLRPSGGRA